MILAGLYLAFPHYRDRYAYPKSGEDYWIYINPFQISQDAFGKMCDPAEVYLRQGDSSQAMATARRALTYRGSFNEMQYSKIFSDGNYFQTYKLQQLIGYSKCYELVGRPDSALAVLAQGMMMNETYQYDIEDRFFRLARQIFGTHAVRNMIAIGLNDLQPVTDSIPYHQYTSFVSCYDLGPAKPGIHESDTAEVRQNRESFLSTRYKRYGLE